MELIATPSAYRRAKAGGWLAGGVISGIALAGLVLIVVTYVGGNPHVTGKVLLDSLLFLGSFAAIGVLFGLLVYGAWLAPPVATLQEQTLTLKYPIRTVRIPQAQIQMIYRGLIGGGMAGRTNPAYLLFTGAKWGWRGRGFLLTTYDPAELEKFVSAFGVPVRGDFTKFVTPWSDASTL